MSNVRTNHSRNRSWRPAKQAPTPPMSDPVMLTLDQLIARLQELRTDDETGALPVMHVDFTWGESEVSEVNVRERTSYGSRELVHVLVG